MRKTPPEIPDVILNRLPLYYKHLKKIKNKNIEYISSEELAKHTGFSSSLIRKDLNYFGTFGKKSYGYDVSCLCRQIQLIMGMHISKTLIIIGAGNMGQALAFNSGLNERGYKLKALFDVKVDLIGKSINGSPILSTEELIPFIKKEDIDIAILTVPSEVAQEITDIIIRANIKGIWDFTEIPLKVPDHVFLEEQHINEGLCKLSYKLFQNHPY